MIQLTYKTKTEYVQKIELGIDSGYANIGFSAIDEKKEYIAGEVQLLTGMKERIHFYIERIKAGVFNTALKRNDDVKVFAKKLKESDNTNLQYVGIMPINESLTSYIEKVDDAKINELISNLKSFERFEDFEEGYITRVKGFIPKFSFDYELDLKEQLNALGVTDIFDVEKADISGIVEAEGAYISDAIHKANIEFTQDGIKAAAVTQFGGLGAGDPFDYYLEMKVKEIDLTFDKPYMFIVRDVKTGEVWFTGTVYEPLNIEEEPEKERDSLATYEK